MIRKKEKTKELSEIERTAKEKMILIRLRPLFRLDFISLHSLYLLRSVASEVCASQNQTFEKTGF